jgi:O-antigen/teichoic acid export membrane protein
MAQIGNSSAVLSVIRRVGQHRLTRDYALAGGGLGLARLASVATLVLLTRALAPPAFAVYSLGWATWLLTSQLTSGLDLAYVNLRARGDSEFALLRAYWSLKLRTGTCLVMGTVAIVLSLRGLASWGTADAEAAIIGGASGAATALYQTELSAHQARQQFGRFAIGWVLLNVATLIGTALLMVLQEKSALPYVAVYGIVPLALAAPALARHKTPIDGSTKAQARRKLVRHARWLLPSGAINSFSNRADVLIASALLVTHDFAVYTAAIRFYGLFQFALTSMGTVLLPRASRLGRGTTLRSYISGVLALTLATSLAGLVCVMQSHNIAVLVLGQEYAAAASLMPALSIAAVFFAANITLRLLLLSINRPGAYALESTILLVAKIPAAFLLIPLLGITGAAWSVVVSVLVGTVYLFAVLFADRDRLRALRPAVDADIEPASPAATIIS